MIAVMHPSASTEDVEHLIEHVTMLGGDTHAIANALGKAGQLVDDRSQLDGFRAGSENGQDANRRRPHAPILRCLAHAPGLGWQR